MNDLKIGFIGAGKVGVSFGLYLKANGFYVAGYYSRSAESAEHAAESVGCRRYESPSALLLDIDLLFITTNDSEIAKVCAALAGMHAFRKGQIVVHMSGALSSSILKSAERQGCLTFSLHPIQSFADTKKAVSELPGTVFSMEGNNGNCTVLEGLLRQTGNRYFKIAPGDKVLYHAAACIFSNYFTTLMDEGLRYLEHIGIDPQEGMQAVLPLVTGTLSNIGRLGAEAALTGPIARGDMDTVKSHLEAISYSLPERLSFYLTMAERTLELAEGKKTADPDSAEALRRIIADYKNEFKLKGAHTI